jgi:hypothetical protein
VPESVAPLGDRKELTDQDLAALMSGLGFDMTTDQPCKRTAQMIGVATICIFTGKDGEFNYWLSVASPGPGEPQKVGLNIRARTL